MRVGSGEEWLARMYPRRDWYGSADVETTYGPLCNADTPLAPQGTAWWKKHWLQSRKRNVGRRRADGMKLAASAGMADAA